MRFTIALGLFLVGFGMAAPSVNKATDALAKRVSRPNPLSIIYIFGSLCRRFCGTRKDLVTNLFSTI